MVVLPGVDCHGVEAGSPRHELSITLCADLPKVGYGPCQLLLEPGDPLFRESGKEVREGRLCRCHHPGAGVS